MEGFMFSPYNFNGYPGCGPMMAPILHGNPKFKPHTWGKGSIYVPPEALDYLDVCKRAQLKAILSQVNPNLTPRLRKANTKEFGVQVNAQVDAMVQCSLGPKTLFYRERKFPLFSKSPVKCQQSPSAASSLDPKALPSTPVNNVRFSRPLAIYSPVFDRRFFALPVKAQDDGVYCEGGEGGGNGAIDEDGEADVTEQKTEDQVRPEIPREVVRKPLHQTPKGFNFQFLEQKYGFFHCSQCNVRWESAYVWCISGTSKVYFKQLCRKCQNGFNPYRVESIQCKVCSQTRCCCEQKERHIDMKRPHRQDLCGRCRGKRISCDTTYSYKYIV
ncbi:protein ZAR1-like [Oncorhynchus kisutch]|uniref:Zygote arrest 1-like n=1 Tax=Oncorhynchus kisutch TaxID=8019 RepID=A0A8C7K589_ONCKI|nr:ZAR1-like protein [Oncorhynchus kisutch]